MDRVFFEIKEIRLISPSQQPYPLSQSPPPPIANLESNGFSLNSKVSPSILLIIVILAIIFFVSGFLHLLVRFLLRHPNRDPDDLDNVTALQGQLQQLFHLHDAGVDQSFIDTLPVFNYKAIIGLKDPFDCAVCLCEFEAEDKLRLLPKCSHAFHMDCIDTWLLSHSTCPLCRASLLPDFSPHNSCSPVVLVLESGSDSSREMLLDRDGVLGSNNLGQRANSHLGCRREDEFGSSPIAVSHKSCEILMKDDGNQPAVVGSEETVLPVKLGKFRNVDGGAGGEGSSTSNVDSRRCFSMGSFEYVMDETSSLQVPIGTPLKKQSNTKPSRPLAHGLRQAMSECDCDSRREFNGFEPFKGFGIRGAGGGGGIGNDTGSGSAIGSSKRESFSVSKIWLLGKKDKPNSTAVESSRRASSLRLPVHRNVVSPNDLKAKNVESGRRSSISEIDLRRWENGGGDVGGDEEFQSCNSLEFQPKTPSFTRTLLWLVGRQNKVVHSSSSPSV